MRMRVAIIATTAVITMMAVAGCAGDGQKGASAAASPSPGGKGAGASVSAGDAIAERVATHETPAGCRSITLRWKVKTETVKVLSDEPADIGKGGRIKEMEDTDQGRSDRTWTVTFYGPGYTGNSGMAADGTTRAEVLSQARLAYEKAGATLG
jgi:hypothetical protein